MQENHVDVAIVGAGIAGLAHAYFALKKGLRVVLFERDHFAVGASIRNFGLVWPVGQLPGEATALALRSREHWISLAAEMGAWIDTNGSLQLAHADDEWQVLEEFSRSYKNDFGLDFELIDPAEVVRLSPRVRTSDLRGGLLSKTECTVNSRQILAQLPCYLIERYGLEYVPATVVRDIHLPVVRTSRGDWHAEQVIICSGADFETLYPEIYQRQGFTKCKLQMMKGRPRTPFVLGPTLSAGLTLRHYASFSQCPGLSAVDARYDAHSPEYKQHGIHVLIAQNNEGDLIIGDSHSYAQTQDPFESEAINALILTYAATFFNLDSIDIIERWHGVYPKYPGQKPLVWSPEKGVTLVNGLSGAGMTLSFGLAEKVLNEI